MYSDMRTAARPQPTKHPQQRQSRERYYPKLQTRDIVPKPILLGFEALLTDTPQSTPQASNKGRRSQAGTSRFRSRFPPFLAQSHLVLLLLLSLSDWKREQRTRSKQGSGSLLRPGLRLGLRLGWRLWDAMPTRPQGKLKERSFQSTHAQASLDRRAERQTLLSGAPGSGLEPVGARGPRQGGAAGGGGREVEDGVGHRG
jgi:hypothetical protein